MATSPVETVGTSRLLTRRDGPKLSAEREAYCFGATASDPSPASVDLDQQELCRGNTRRSGRAACFRSQFFGNHHP